MSSGADRVVMVVEFEWPKKKSLDPIIDPLRAQVRQVLPDDVAASAYVRWRRGEVAESVIALCEDRRHD